MRREKICFKCKAPWDCTHVCPNRELRVLTIINGIEMGVLDSEDDGCKDGGGEIVWTLSTLHCL